MSCRRTNNSPPAGGPRTNYERHAEMLAFDHLPRRLRRATREAMFNYSSEAILTRHNQGETVDELIEGLAAADQRNAERHQAELAALARGAA